MKMVSWRSETQHGPQQDHNKGDGCTGLTQSSGSTLPPFTLPAGAKPVVLQLDPVPEHACL